MKITLAILGLAAAASAYPMFLLEDEPAVYRVARMSRRTRLTKQKKIKRKMKLGTKMRTI